MKFVHGPWRLSSPQFSHPAQQSVNNKAPIINVINFTVTLFENKY